MSRVSVWFQVISALVLAELIPTHIINYLSVNYFILIGYLSLNFLCASPNYLIDGGNQLRYLNLEGGMAEYKRMAASERLQTRRQIIGLRHFRPINQYRHDPNICL